MLRELSVQNLALIEDVQVELEGGFCALDGGDRGGEEPAAHGARAGSWREGLADLVRSGKAEARASAVFEIEDQALRGELETILGGVLDEDALIVTRRVSAQGRSSAQVNGMPVTIATLQRLGEQMVDIHGQNEGRALLDPDRQRDLLDAFGELDEPLEAYRRARAAHDGLRRKRQALLDATQARQRERALLEFERDELASANPRPGEHDELVRDSHLLANAEALCAAAAEGYDLLYEADHSAQEILKRVARSLEPLADSVPELSGAAATLERLADETREVAYSLRAMGQSWEDNPARLEDIEARLALYRRLAARFHCTADELAARRVETEAKLASIERDEEDLEHLDAPLAEAFQARQIGRGRAFGRAAEDGPGLRPGNPVAAQAAGPGESTAHGRGRDPRPGRRPDGFLAPRIRGRLCRDAFPRQPGRGAVAAEEDRLGGELSRVTLAAKTVLACADRVATLVLDEIDTGVGGRLGAALGKTLSELAPHHQVVCVTHLPQVACYARRQWVIRKQTERGRTTTTITPLSDADRVHELALMLRGESAAEGTRQEALAMLREAQGLQKAGAGINNGRASAGD